MGVSLLDQQELTGKNNEPFWSRLQQGKIGKWDNFTHFCHWKNEI